MKNLTATLLFVLFYLGAIFGQSEDKTIHLMDAKGDTVSLNLNQLERPLIISAFAVGCGHCMKEMKAYSEKYPEWKSNCNVDVIAVSTNSSSKYIRKDFIPFCERSMYMFKLYVDFNSELLSLLINTEGIKKELFPTYKENLIMRIPQTIIFDTKGNLIYQKHGFTDGDEQKVEDVIKNL